MEQEAVEYEGVSGLDKRTDRVLERRRILFAGHKIGSEMRLWPQSRAASLGGLHRERYEDGHVVYGRIFRRVALPRAVGVSRLALRAGSGQHDAARANARFRAQNFNEIREAAGIERGGDALQFVGGDEHVVPTGAAIRNGSVRLGKIRRHGFPRSTPHLARGTRSQRPLLSRVCCANVLGDGRRALEKLVDERAGESAAPHHVPETQIVLNAGNNIIASDENRIARR